MNPYATTNEQRKIQNCPLFNEIPKNPNIQVPILNFLTQKKKKKKKIPKSFYNKPRKIK